MLWKVQAELPSLTAEVSQTLYFTPHLLKKYGDKLNVEEKTGTFMESVC